MWLMLFFFLIDPTKNIIELFFSYLLKMKINPIDLIGMKEIGAQLLFISSMIRVMPPA